MSYLTLLGAVAQVIGGTQPTQAQATAGSGVAAANLPYWYSGSDTADSTGVAGLVGCFSIPTETLPAGAVALVLPDLWKPTENFPLYDKSYREDIIHIRVMAGHTDLQTAMASLVNFADTVPAIFDKNMTLLGQANVDTGWCSAGTFLEVEWPVGTVYMAIQFELGVQRSIVVNRTA